MSDAGHFLLPNLQQVTPGTPTSAATTPSHGNLPPTPGSALNSPASKTLGEKNTHKLPDIKSQKSPVFNRRRSSSVTLAQPPTDLHRFSSVRGTEDVTAWRGDPGGGSGNSTGYSRERYCKSPVNRPQADCTTPGSSRPTKQKQRMRTASMPAENRKPRLSELRRSAIHCADVDIEYYRLRSFSITSHGICNLGDSMRSRRSRSINSVTSSNSGRDRHNSNASQTTTNDLAMDTEQGDSTTAYKVAMLGASGVGKTALTYQFTTSEYICAYDLSLDDDYGQKTVSVLLDGQETDLEIIDHPACEMSTEAFCSTYNIDIFVVVYSVVDRKTFKAAEKVLHYLKDNEMLLTRGAILVGNKTDLERHREVPTQGGRRLAKEVSCKFIETSSGLDHNVDELLVGIVAQVKLNPQRLCNLTEEQKQGLRLAGIPGCSVVNKVKEEEMEAAKARKRQGAHSSGPLNALDLHTLKNSFENKENIPRRTRNRQRQPQKSGLNEEDEDNKSTTSSVSSSSSSSLNENEVNLLSQGSTSCSSTPTKHPAPYDAPKTAKKKNLAAEKAVARFSNRTKLFLTSFLKFKKNLRGKRRNSNSCSDLFVI
uniref:Putative ras-related gtpase n=1 Tax=Nyssomyia neivai TaxID=330878 RepID=A0A1L8DLC1_9DIPT